ncbi:MAG: DNRLRE domain-containing protein [Candidatus Lokiarchaeota archaeon]|nr:DNRLRE domain-containing protein [Candidatus Lokiarchaeota archaeon]
MRRKYCILSFLIIITALNFCSIPLAVKALEDNKSFVAIADSFIDEGDPDANFGGFTYLYVGYRYNWTKAFIKFDLLTSPKNFHKAELRIAFTYVENSSLLEIYDTNTGWGEYSITWNNSPIFGNLIASSYIPGDTQLYEHIKIDITDDLETITGYWSIVLTLANMSLIKIAPKEHAPPPTILYYYQTSDLLMFGKTTLVGSIGVVIVGVVFYRLRLRKSKRS